MTEGWRCIWATVATTSWPVEGLNVYECGLSSTILTYGSPCTDAWQDSRPGCEDE
jgi:hypothetical protein